MVGGAADTPAFQESVESAHTERINSLVYLSETYNQDGVIRPEYIGRMEKAIIDGELLGLSSRFVEQVRGQIHAVKPPTEDTQPTSTTDQDLGRL